MLDYGKIWILSKLFYTFKEIYTASPQFHLDRNANEVRIKALEDIVTNFVEESKLQQDDRKKLLALIEDLQIQLNDANNEIIEHANQSEEIQG